MRLLRIALCLFAMALVSGPAVAQTLVPVSPAFLLGRQIGRSLSEAMKAGQEFAASKQELSLEIAEARRRFWSNYPDGTDRAAAEAQFSKLLFAKDWSYLALYVPEGPYGDRARFMAGLGGQIDNGIPEAARGAFIDWVNAIRESMGARNHMPTEGRQPDLVEFTIPRFMQALGTREIQEKYDTYKLARDRSEFAAVGRSQEFDAFAKQQASEAPPTSPAAATELETIIVGKQNLWVAEGSGSIRRFGEVLAANPSRALMGGLGSPVLLYDLEGKKLIAKLKEGRAAALSDRWAVVGDPIARRDIVIASGFNVPRLSVQTNRAAGLAYIHDANTGALVATLAPEQKPDQPRPNRNPTPRFGDAVAVSGDYVVVGAPGELYADVYGFNAEPGTGAVYIFDAKTGRQISRLTGTGEKQFGAAVDARDGKLAVGAPGSKPFEEWDPYAAVYDLATGNPIARVTNPERMKASGFGHAVALSGDLLLVGALIKQQSVFAFNIDSRQLVYQLDGKALTGKRGPSFGVSLSVDGHWFAIGSSDSNQVFIADPRNGKLWKTLDLQQEDLDQPGLVSRATPDRPAFGFKTAIAGSSLLIGAPTTGLGSGKVYVVPQLFPIAANE